MVFDNRILNGLDEEGVAVQRKVTILEADVVKDTDNFGEIKNKADMREEFSQIRRKVQKALSSAELTELYRQAGSLIKLLDMESFQQKVSDKIDGIRQVAEKEFATTARELNNRADRVGAASNYAEQWGD